MFSLSPLNRSKVYDCTSSVFHDAFKDAQDDFMSVSARTGPVLLAAIAAAVLAAASEACADFNEKWNSSNPDPVMRLPVELTSKCFRTLSTRDRFTVSHVSRAWRRTALADAFLWTDLRFTFCRSHSIDELATLLSRSHPAPFYFSWDEVSYSDDGPSVGGDEFFGAMLELVLRHVSRMQSFEVRCDGRRHRDVLAQLCARPAPLLRKLVIDIPSTDPVILPGLWGTQLVPRLQCLFVGTFSIPPEFAPLHSLREFRGDLRDGHRDCGLHNLFDIFPGLISLNLTRITAEDLAAFPALPPSLTDIVFDPRQGRLIDYTAFVENAIGDNHTVRRFCARYATCIPATIDALARKARGRPWSLCIDPRGVCSGGTGATVTFGSDDDGSCYRYEIQTVTNEWWLREPTPTLMRTNLESLASLTLPWSALIRLASASSSCQWDHTLPSLRALTVTAYGRGERRTLATLASESSSASSSFTPVRAPQLEALAIKNTHFSPPSWLAAVIPRLVAYDCARLAVARVEASLYSNAATLDSLQVAHMARRVLLLLEKVGSVSGSESVIAEFVDGERVNGSPALSPRSSSSRGRQTESDSEDGDEDDE